MTFITENKKITRIFNHHLRQLTERFSKLLPIRIDLHYNPKQGTTIKDKEACDDIQLLCERVIKEIKHLDGFIWVMETSETGNIHFHAIFYANGQFKRKYYPLYVKITEIWETLVGNKCYTFDCNKNRNHYKYNVLKVFNHDDVEAKNKLKYVFLYLSKKEQKESIGEQYQYGVSKVPTPTGRGRPRKINQLSLNPT